MYHTLGSLLVFYNTASPSGKKFSQTIHFFGSSAKIVE